MNPFERLDILGKGTIIQIESFPDIWLVHIRPIEGGYPLVRGKAETLSEAIKQAIELWESK